MKKKILIQIEGLEQELTEDQYKKIEHLFKNEIQRIVQREGPALSITIGEYSDRKSPYPKE
jgi:hypothetical protein